MPWALALGGGFLVPGVYLGAHLTFIVFLKWPKNSAVQFEVNLISIRKSTMRQEKQERLHEAETALAVLSCPVLNTAIKQKRKDTYPFFCLFFFSFFYVPAIMPPFACLLLRPYPVADAILINPAPRIVFHVLEAGQYRPVTFHVCLRLLLKMWCIITNNAQKGEKLLL